MRTTMTMMIVVVLVAVAMTVTTRGMSRVAHVGLAIEMTIAMTIGVIVAPAETERTIAMTTEEGAGVPATTIGTVTVMTAGGKIVQIAVVPETGTRVIRREIVDVAGTEIAIVTMTTTRTVAVGDGSVRPPLQ